MSRRIVHTKVIEGANETITLTYGPFQWFASKCKYRHVSGEDVPFIDCWYKQPPGKFGHCCYRYCKRYKRKRSPR